MSLRKIGGVRLMNSSLVHTYTYLTGIAMLSQYFPKQHGGFIPQWICMLFHQTES